MASKNIHAHDGTSVKNFYAEHADRITKKRTQSPYPLRRYVHEQQYASVAQFVEPGMRVLDDGCGEGTLSFMLSAKGAQVTGCDISRPNIEICNQRREAQHASNAAFLIADSEELPFPDNSFDMVVSSHVLEHLPNFDKGLKEIMRVTKKRAVIAIPTVCNPCSLVQVGHGWFWLKGPRSFLAFLYGLVRLCAALARGDEGVDERYAGHDVPHIFRFPWVMKKKLKLLEFRLVSYQADSLCMPFFDTLLPLLKRLNAYRAVPVLRGMGYGTLYVIEKADN